jgi:hypothetical protein
MREPRKFTLKDQGVRLWLLCIVAIALIMLASRERGWWIWGMVGWLFHFDLLFWERDWFGRNAVGRCNLWGLGPPYLTRHEGCLLWAGVILQATVCLGFLLF